MSGPPAVQILDSCFWMLLGILDFGFGCLCGSSLLAPSGPIFFIWHPHLFFGSRFGGWGLVFGPGFGVR